MQLRGVVLVHGCSRLSPVEGANPSVLGIRIWYTGQEWPATHPPSLGHSAPGNALVIYFFSGDSSPAMLKPGTMAFLVHTVQLLRHHRSRQRGQAGGRESSSPSFPGCLSQATATRAGPASVRKAPVGHSHSMNWGKAEGPVGRAPQALAQQSLSK